jgi:hypothetical protein
MPFYFSMADKMADEQWVISGTWRRRIMTIGLTGAAFARELTFDREMQETSNRPRSHLMRSSY